MPSAKLLGPDDPSPVMELSDYRKIIPVGDHYAALDFSGSVVGIVERSTEPDGKHWHWLSIDGSSGQMYTSLRHALELAARYVGTIR